MITASVGDVRLEHLHTPTALGTGSPRLSWVTVAPPEWRQSFAELELHGGSATQSATLQGDASVLVDWPFDVLPPFAAVRVRVRVHGVSGHAASSSEWSEWCDVRTGPLVAQDWVAEAVGAAETPGATPRPAVLLRKDFHLVDLPAAATLFASAHGLYEFEINGVRVGDHELAPGWTSYHRRLRWDSHDVTDLLHVGMNTVGVWLADGWYRGRLGWNGGHRDLYGDRTALIAQLELRSTAGERSTVVSDATWRTASAPITSTGLLEGERYDARLERAGWSAPGFDDGSWSPVEVVPFDHSRLEGPLAGPIRRIEERPPVSVTPLDGDRIRLDFGQNLVGRLAVSVRGAEGHRLRIRHAEVLEDGELATRPLRDALAEDEYVLGGRSDGEQWHPRFTIHGFRYAEISGWTGGDAGECIVAQVIHTDMERTGWFECSDPVLERLHENVVWSMRGNFVGLPTDCPQRDERLGWTGDIQVFAPVALFLYGSAGLLTSWLRDVAAEQYDDGTIPWYVPEIPGGSWWTPARPGAGWGDAAVLVPWALHRASGDSGAVREQYESASRWVDLVDRRTRGTGLWAFDFQLGDWLDPTAPPDRPAEGLTDPDLVATAYHSWSARRLADLGRLLGRHDDAARYATIADRAASAFRARFLDESTGRLSSDSQTSYALAIVFGLLDPDQTGRAGERLAELVDHADGRLTTGFLGTPVLLEALSGTGHLDAAMTLLLQRESPSWLHPVLLGATTVWERWDSMLSDGTVNPGDMTSFNHYALGAVAEWMHTRLAGLAPDAPGYRRISVRPHPHAALSYARARHHTPYGQAEAGWRRLDDGLIEVIAVIPTGTTARIILPDATEHEVGSGRHRFVARDVQSAARAFAAAGPV